ncbi:BT4734/BF3469 family protein [Elizabethkingia anophelis]|uniref:BT4734/BF3469 family protein n=1 Tax=Elizabethkingia anophelis TaxID=1117645 RepID=UPI0020133300|nr:BT4734/BF3469 family protein [Elizabethkingia anophelis]MCL1690465.1 hypothetical protein [Elizabethkingia anophelis]
MINKINCCTNRAITGSFQNIEEVVNFIKTPPPEHINLVNEARSLNRKSNEYGDIKKNRLPAISVGFSFSNNYIRGINLDSPTGYLYLDVDGVTEEDFEINTAYVCAYWRSLSNTGLSLVVKVEGLTPYNLKTATTEIARLLNIPHDTQAVSIDRLTVLPYDPNAYYNDNTDIIPISEILPINDTVTPLQTEKSIHSNNIKESISLGYDYNGYNLRFNNLNELLKSYNIEYDENGFYDLGKDNKLRYAQVFVPFKLVNVGSREAVLKSITYQLLALNKDAPESLLLKYLHSVNYKAMNPPLEDREVKITFDKTYDKIKGIIPIFNAERRFLYDPYRDLSAREKRQLNLKQIHKDTVTRTTKELLDIMNTWNEEQYGKMTISKITDVSGKNKKTVQKYYGKLKSQILINKKK